LFPQALKEKLVQDHGVHRDQLLALEAVDQVVGRARVVEFGKLILDAV
jgi:hypothetical protein